MNWTHNFWSAVGGAILAILLTRYVPGGPVGFMLFLSTLVVTSTVIASTRYLADLISRTLMRATSLRPEILPERWISPPPPSGGTRHIDVP